MPVWLGPLLKVLPHLATIATAVAPAFTKRKVAPAGNQSELTQQQIAELQAAASLTDDRVRSLATELKDALAAIEQGALVMEERFKRLQIICMVAVCISVFALIVSAVTFVAR
jgi:hypothetical protein